MTHAQVAEHIGYSSVKGSFTRLKGAKAGMPCRLHKSGGHHRIFVCGRAVRAHHLAWVLMTGEWPSGPLDHINGDGLDNRWANLRACTITINNQNRAKPQRDNKTSNFLGVCSVSKTPGRFRAQIKVNGRKIHLGTFQTEEEAAAAYLAAKREMHPGFVAERFT